MFERTHDRSLLQRGLHLHLISCSKLKWKEWKKILLSGEAWVSTLVGNLYLT